MSLLTLDILEADRDTIHAGGKHCMGGCGKWLPTVHRMGERTIIEHVCGSKRCMRQLCRISDGLDPLEVIDGGRGA